MSKKNHYNKEKKQFNYEMIISLVIVMGSIIGTTIPLYIHSSNQIDAIRQDIREFHEEMKQFHGKLCAIEERNKK